MPESKKRKKKKEESEQGPKRKPVGFHLTDNEIFELGFNGVHTYFICHDFTERTWSKKLEIPINDDLILVPLHDDLIDKGVIHLPTAPEPYGSERDLFDLVRHFIHKYVAVSEFYERLSSYYCLFSWLYDRFNTLPYLRAIGDYGTGKSRFLQTIGSICYRPVFASGATTVSPIFRLIDRHQGTLILDEADFKHSDSDAEICKILNCGYQAGFPVIRSEARGNTFEPVGYFVYGPKLLATRKRFKDKALESRCLTEEMDFQFRADIPIILPDTFWDEALEIRNRLLMWRFNKYPSICLRQDLINESIEPRLNQIFAPISSIVQDQTMLGDLKEFAEKYNKSIVTERGMQLEAEVLQSVVDLARDGNKQPQMKEIAQQTNKERLEKDHISPHKVGWIVGERLRLEKIRGRVYSLKWDGEKIKKLCERYGIVIDESDFVRLFDFNDLLREAPEEVETEDCDFPGPSHKKSPKSQSRQPGQTKNRFGN